MYHVLALVCTMLLLTHNLPLRSDRLLKKTCKKWFARLSRLYKILLIFVENGEKTQIDKKFFKPTKIDFSTGIFKKRSRASLEAQGFTQFPQSFPQANTPKNSSFPQILWKTLLRKLHNQYQNTFK